MLFPRKNEQHEVALYDLEGREVPKTALGRQQGQPLSLDDKPVPGGQHDLGLLWTSGLAPDTGRVWPVFVSRGQAEECSQFKLTDYFEISAPGQYRLRFQQRLYQLHTNSVLIGINLPEVTLLLDLKSMKK